MSITEQIIAGDVKRNAIYNIPIKEIINSGLWYPGEFITEVCTCKTKYYHTCSDNDTRWGYAFNLVKSDFRFGNIKSSIEEHGFLAPLGAKLGNNKNHLVLVDGHHRLVAAWDLDIPMVPVYVGSSSKNIRSLVAGDSNGWIKGKIDSPWLNQYI